MATIQDRIFGKLVWEDDFDWERGWTGSAEFLPGVFVDVLIWCENPSEFLIVGQARKVFENLRETEQAIRRFAADELLQLYNEEWRGKHEKWLKPHEFCERLKPSRIEIFEDKSVGFEYESDLFDDELISISIDGNGEFENIEIVEA